jgi:poly(3-hydroxybutyrate) depolymerase
MEGVMRVTARIVLMLLVAVVAAPFTARGSDWKADLAELLSTPEGAEIEGALDRVVRSAPDWTSVALALESLEFPGVPAAGEPSLRSSVCTDTVERPWVLLVPPGYDPSVPTPLLVVLHGGASQAEIPDDPVGEVRDNEFAAWALENGWISVFPFAQAGATWWEDVGMANVRSIVRTAKRELNIDDDRVWMCGFSDGASAGFLNAMLTPGDYAAFVALNGHMGVGSLDGNLPIYAPNMAATPIFATTTFDDGLYPSRKMRESFKMAMAAGADILYRELPGRHDFDDVAGELPSIARFLERHVRDPFPSRITWEAARGEFGACRWFVIDEVLAVDAADWHVDHNVSMIDDRVTVGFHPDYEFEGPGILVSSLSDGDYPARRIGLASGDVIVRAGAVRTDSLANLNEWKTTVSRGDPFTLTVLREGEEVVLGGTLPEPSAYFIFKRDVPSAAARVSFAANRVDVATSRVGALRVLVHPDMVAMGENLVIAVDGVVVHDAPVEPDVEFMLRNFLENRDRRLVYVAEVVVEVE